ncbi:hypothetical protein BJX61DRAFT_543531 [Aspergillus egyptiacus]|nr:hypothetical protein BJX61DRAFT_543531 [Aspergillus egyptiacus]
MSCWKRKPRCVLQVFKPSWRYTRLPSTEDISSGESGSTPSKTPLISYSKTFFARVTAKKTKLESSLLNLPPELHWLIFSLLPLPSQACLALTCKQFYRLFSHVLEDERLAWPRLLASQSYTALLGHPGSPRTQLLRRFEDDYWSYCPGCLKLHPAEDSLDYPLPMTDACSSIYSDQPIVDLCPCLALTYCDRLRLEEWLRTEHASPLLSRRIRCAFQRRLNSLQHDCWMFHHADAFVRSVMTVALDEQGCLIVRTRYHHIDRLYSRPCDMEPIFLCPHVNIFEYILVPLLWVDNRCMLCDASMQDLSSAEYGYHHVVQSVRTLGDRGEDGRETWCLQARHESERLKRKWYLHGVDAESEVGIVHLDSRGRALVFPTPEYPHGNT